MTLIYTGQSYQSLDESIDFLLYEQGMPLEKVLELREKLFDRADELVDYPKMGQLEEYLEHLNKNHRRLIEGYFKIIYRIEGDTIYVTDFFDTRQDPATMKG